MVGLKQGKEKGGSGGVEEGVEGRGSMRRREEA